jgi:hypothetical protein
MAFIKPAAIVIATAAFVLTVVAAGHAQTLDVTVPFAFQVQNTTLPAGHYEVDTDYSTGIVMLRGERGTPGGAFVLTEPSSVADPNGAAPSLSFSRYENGYRLAGIWESANDGRAVAKK